MWYVTALPFFLASLSLLYYYLYKNAMTDVIAHLVLILMLATSFKSASLFGGWSIIRFTTLPFMCPTSTFLFPSRRWPIIYFLLSVLLSSYFYYFKPDEPAEFFRRYAFQFEMRSSTAIWLLFCFFAYMRAQYLTQIRRERDKARELANIKDSFTRNVSHEIRTPLHAIIGLTELLAQDPRLVNNKDIKDTITNILSSSDHLSHLLDSILDFAKLERGAQILEDVPFELGGLVESTLRLFSPLVEENHMRLTLTYDHHLHTHHTSSSSSSSSSSFPFAPCMVTGDPHRMRQLIQNLVGNAIKFSPEYTGEIHVRVAVSKLGTVSKAHKTNRISVVLSVHDNGIGVNAEALKRLQEFQPFSQEDASTTRRYGGTGLGLAICRQICVMMGGSLVMTSQPGQGTCVRASLVVDQVPDTIPTFVEAKDMLTKGNIMALKQARIAVISPSHNVRSFVETMWSLMMASPPSSPSSSPSSCSDSLDNVVVFQRQDDYLAYHPGAFSAVVCDIDDESQRLPEEHLRRVVYVVPGKLLTSITRKQMFAHAPNLACCLANPLTLLSLVQSLNNVLNANLSYIPSSPPSFFQGSPLPSPVSSPLMFQPPSPSSPRPLASPRVPLSLHAPSSPSSSSSLILSGPSPRLLAAAAAVGSNNKLILVAEDNEMNQKIILRQLSLLGLQYDLTNNGQEAAMAFKTRGPYAAILMDCQMPIMDGYESARDIRRQEALLSSSSSSLTLLPRSHHEVRRVPIVALTASAMVDEKKKCFDSGMDRCYDWMHTWLVSAPLCFPL
eukprot:TRINITY_DN4885_c0_g1_i1.p1 TRINITY_DN4885_c0_g1~~TRINITY_DN4885_c0_g1_i1.p1  ORF type:complete len:863 (-),score=218.55 TRINITY_DN4885_c0_g1_i1:1181-3529(-)